MKLTTFFNYKDWWSYVFWAILLVCLSDFIRNLDTLVRWKWGYWSIDLIPSVIVLLILWFANEKIISDRRWKWTKKQLNDVSGRNHDK